MAKGKESVKKPFVPRAGFGGPQPNSGRTSKAAMLGVAELIDKNWPKDRQALAIQRIANIIDGDDDKLSLEAWKVLAGYAYGKPKEIREITGADGGPLNVTVSYVNRPIS